MLGIPCDESGVHQGQAVEVAHMLGSCCFFLTRLSVAFIGGPMGCWVVGGMRDYVDTITVRYAME
jgi:hypothetical protein